MGDAQKLKKAENDVNEQLTLKKNNSNHSNPRNDVTLLDFETQNLVTVTQ